MNHLSRGLRPLAWPGLVAAAALAVNGTGEAATREGTRYRRRSRPSAGSPKPRVTTHQSWSRRPTFARGLLGVGAIVITRPAASAVG